jgi:CRP/FNR family transcriptional regulator
MATVTLDALRQVPYLAPLDAKILLGLAPAVRLRTYKAGEIVLAEGDRCEGLYFIVRGRVKLFKTSIEGKEQVLRILGPGRTFNDIPVFDGGPNPGSVAVMENSAIGTLPTAYVLTLVETQPKAALAVIRVLASRMRALTLLVEDLSLRGVVARVARRLLDCARGHHTISG